jgi:hypothetical protein
MLDFDERDLVRYPERASGITSLLTLTSGQGGEKHGGVQNSANAENGKPAGIALFLLGLYAVIQHVKKRHQHQGLS